MVMVRVACDLYGRKHNYAFKFVCHPNLLELRRAVQEGYEKIMHLARPPRVPELQFRIQYFQLFDKQLGRWVDLFHASQLYGGAQLFCWQEDSRHNAQDSVEALPTKALFIGQAISALESSRLGSTTGQLSERLREVFDFFSDDARGTSGLAVAITAVTDPLAGYRPLTSTKAAGPQDTALSFDEWVTFASRNTSVVNELWERMKEIIAKKKMKIPKKEVQAWCDLEVGGQRPRRPVTAAPVRRKDGDYQRKGGGGLVRVRPAVTDEQTKASQYQRKWQGNEQNASAGIAPPGIRSKSVERNRSVSPGVSLPMSASPRRCHSATRQCVEDNVKFSLAPPRELQEGTTSPRNDARDTDEDLTTFPAVVWGEPERDVERPLRVADRRPFIFRSAEQHEKGVRKFTALWKSPTSVQVSYSDPSPDVGKTEIHPTKVSPKLSSNLAIRDPERHHPERHPGPPHEAPTDPPRASRPDGSPRRPARSPAGGAADALKRLQNTTFVAGRWKVAAKGGDGE
eukprot:Hpha_TRINITY_DN25983_c0_g1::TRINITY_DN25983_c0_g1_i1::g.185245::m.185245